MAESVYVCTFNIHGRSITQRVFDITRVEPCNISPLGGICYIIEEHTRTLWRTGTMLLQLTSFMNLFAYLVSYIFALLLIVLIIY